MGLPSRSAAGLAAALTTTLTAACLSALPGSAQAAGVDPLPVGAGATYLRSQLAGDLLPTATPVPDSLDAALGLQVSGDAARAAAIRTAVGAPADAAAYTAYVGSSADPNPDPVARVASYVQQLGGDPTTYGSSGNLITTLSALVDDTGRLGEETGDASPQVATTAGQVFATGALVTAGNADGAVATTYSGSLQCAAGFFNDALPAVGAQCDATKPSVQATALYVITMRTVAGTETIRTRALDWLAKAQQSNGRWVTTGGDGPGDSTTTALAAYALAVSGRTGPAGPAAVWLRGNQLLNAGSCPAFPAADVGAVAPDGGTFASTSGRVDDFRRATSQALLVLGSAPGGPGVTDNTVSVPRFARPGTPVIATVRTAPRNLLCASAPTLSPLRVVGGYDSTASFTFTSGAAEGPTTASIVDASGQVDTATVVSLAKKRLGFSFRDKRVRKGKVAVVKVRGLAAGESVKVQFRGKRKNATVADARGQAKLRWIVTGARGYVRVRVVGQYGNRNRAKNIIVTRR